MPEVKMLSHEEVAAIAAIVKKNSCEDAAFVAARIPFGEGYLACFGNFRLAATKYPSQGQYRIEVWANLDDIVIAATDGYVNWPAARLLFELMKERRWEADEGNLPRYLSYFDDQLEFGRKLVAKAIADGKNPKA